MRNPVSSSKHQIPPEYGDKQADAGRDYCHTSRETKFSGANADRELFVFPVKLTMSRIGNLTRLIHMYYCFKTCVTLYKSRPQIIFNLMDLGFHTFSVLSLQPKKLR